MSVRSVFCRLRAGPSRRRLARARRLAAAGDHRRAFPLFARCARHGWPDAAAALGRCYLLGLGVPPHAGQATFWLQRAANDGHPEAHTQLAELALQGVAAGSFGDLFTARPASASPPDWALATHHASRAAHAGSAEAQALLAFILSEGPPERRDMPRAETLFRQAAGAGVARAQLGLANLLLRLGGATGTAEARSHLLAASGQGVPAAHHLLGVLAENDGDHAGAARHYRIAADAGHPPAQTRYAIALLHGRGAARDVFTAETWLRRAARAGEAHAASLLGALYVQGDLLARNPAEGRSWLERAAELGHPAAARALAYLLLAVPRAPDRTRAEALLRQAAAAGDETASRDLRRLGPAPA